MIFLILLLQSESFLNNFKLIYPKSSSKLLHSVNDNFMGNDQIDERLIKRNLFNEGLKLWNKYFVALEKWETKKTYDPILGIEMILNFESITEMLERLEKDSFLLLIYPMIPDLIVEKVTRDRILTVDEIIVLVNFFSKHHLYRQLASLIALSEPKITSDHFKQPSLNDLIYTFENLFKLKPEMIENFIGEIKNDKIFLISSLIACSDSDPEIVRNILTKFTSCETSKIQLLAQVCSGIMLTNYKSENEQFLFRRNENLIEFLSKIIESPSLYLLILLKACHIMNLIKLNSLDVQRILLEIYVDESEESVEKLFAILLKVVKTDYHRNLIKSYRMPCSFSLKLE